MIPPVFWQLLLTLELPAHRAQALIQSVRRSGLDPLTSLKTHPSLSQAEKERLALVDLRAFEKALTSGAELITDLDLDPEWAGVSVTSPALFLHGNRECLRKPRIGIVGTRAPSTYGLAAATKFAEHLSLAGALVVSGGALGIDAAVHRAVLGVGGQTCVVLPSGIDAPYPPANRPMCNQVIEAGGCLLSPFPAGLSNCRKYHFLFRNAVLASLCEAVVVVEAPEASGALHTAGAAIELNKHVFVVPGNITSNGFRGSHALIRDGAILVDHPDQILEDLNWDLAPSREEAESDLDPMSLSILEALDGETLTAEQIITATGLSASEIGSALTDLEIEGLILRAGIGYSRKP